jgi:sulfate adenylyltransferase (ADP) / ATP adenylyltransferase
MSITSIAPCGASARRISPLAMSTDQDIPDALWPQLLRATHSALASGALQPIESEQKFINDHGLRFIVRRVTRQGRLRLDSRARAGATAVNPFLPFDPELFVADISATHVALLNKFNLTPHHLLIVTRRFVPQEVLPDDDDVAALCACLAQVDGLGFYNAGAAAGASQAHKHWQMIPLPLASEGPSTPINTALESVRDRTGVITIPGLAFRHSFTWLDPSLFRRPADATARIALLYPELLGRIGVTSIEREGARYQSAPWNLLITRQWMLAAPRVREDFNRVPINALGFAGSLYARDDAQFATIKRAGPMAALQAVTGTRIE